MKTGDPVEVWNWKNWDPSTGDPSTAWFGGYEFVKKMPRGLVLVRDTSSGVESLYWKREVRRPATTRNNPVESDCQKDCEETFAHDAKSRHKCVRGCHGELVGTGLWDKDNPTTGACVPFAANPVSSSWLWLGAAVALGAVAWLTARKKVDAASWTCRAGHKCVRHADGNIWYDTDVVTKTTTTHTVDPTNLQDLTLVETAPDGRWAEYSLEKPAVLHGPPSVFDF